MIDFSESYIEKLTIHKIGNKYNNDGFHINTELSENDKETEDLLIEYFTRPFTKYNECYEFTHTSDLNLNEIYTYAKSVFDEESFIIQSSNIIKHLYNQSDHPHIKSGEVFIAEIHDVSTEDGDYNALGIFKAERKESFFNVSQSKNLELNVDKGIYTKKVDKACLILNNKEEEGYQVYTIDANSYDAEYWKNNFLNIQYKDNNSLRTSNSVKLCNSFAEEVLKPELGSKEKVSFLSETVKYLEETEKMDFEELTAPLDKELKGEFNNFKTIFEEKNQVEFPEEFEISQAALEHQRKKIKSQIKLDTNISINLDFKNTESYDRFIERGWDDEKQMHFYKVYYNSEK